jgi:hypothetical protein
MAGQAVRVGLGGLAGVLSPRLEAVPRRSLYTWHVGRAPFGVRKPMPHRTRPTDVP